MGGFGSGRHGGTVTAEGTASYVIAASVLTHARLQSGQFAKGTFHFDDGRFTNGCLGSLGRTTRPVVQSIRASWYATA